MAIKWKIYRIICILQMIAAAFIIITSLISFFEHALFSNFSRMVLFLLIISLAIMATSILNNNYPDTPIAGSQKRNFNILFLMNFLFLAFLFGFLIAEYRVMKQFSTVTGISFFRLPFRLQIPLIVYSATLVFQLIILFGLYELRQELYRNFMKRKFEFEKD